MFFQDILRTFRVRFRSSADYNYPVNTNASLSCDSNGALWTVESGVPAADRWSDTNYGPNGVLNSTADRTLTQVGGFNDTGATAYLLLFDATAVPAPGTVPFQSFSLPANGTFGWTPSRNGYLLVNGLVYAASSTPATYTALASNFWVFAEGVL